MILLTSDMVSTGKTFCSINLASIFALYGKKTLLMGFDLRKPKIYQDFGLSNAEGISSYLINKSPLESCIQKSGIENLDIIMAGPIPPNPAELIASERCNEMFRELKEIYDYIIIDNEAGLEHLGRATAGAVDHCLVIVEPGRRSLDTAQQIARLAKDIGIRRLSLIANKVRTEEDLQFIERNRGSLPLMGWLPYLSQAIQADQEGAGVYDAVPQLAQAIAEIAGALGSGTAV